MTPFTFSEICYALGGLGVLLNGLTIWLIVRKSTSDIKGYKYYLLNFTVTDFLFTLTLSLLLQPIPIIPGGGMIIGGCIKVFDYGYPGHCVFVLIAFTFAHSIVGLNYCFLYRYASLCDVAAKRLLERRWFRVCLFGSAEAICFAIGMLIYDMQVPDEVYFGYDYKNSPHANIFLLSALTLAPLSCGYNFLCAFMIALRLRTQGSRLTKRTYNLHLKLMTALLIQTTVPLVLFILPISYVFVSAILLLDSTLTNDTTRYLPVLALGLHPIINPIVTIMFVAPYRDTIFRKFRKIDVSQSPTITFSF